MKTLIRSASLLLASFACVTTGAQAANVLSQTEGGSIDSWDLGTGASMSSFNALFAGSHTFAQTPRFDDPVEMAAYDALWLNNEVYGTGGLTGAEITAITDFIGAGRRAVAITDNNNWTDWNNSLELLLGGTINDGCFYGDGTPLVANSLTAGVGTLSGSSCNSLLDPASNLTMLFSNNMAGVYQIGLGEILLISSVDIIGNHYYAANTQFAQNVVDWLGESIGGGDVPAPAPLVLLAFGLVALGMVRKR